MKWGETEHTKHILHTLWAATLHPAGKATTGLSETKTFRAFMYRYHQPVLELLFAFIL